MTKRKLTKHEDDIRRGLRPAPYEGIHTCSKGCKKPGCAHAARDIEEMEASLAKWQTLAHASELDRNNLSAELRNLKAEVKRLTKAGDAVALDYAERIEIEAGETAKTLMRTVPVLCDWDAAKEGETK